MTSTPPAAVPDPCSGFESGSEPAPAFSVGGARRLQILQKLAAIGMEMVDLVQDHARQVAATVPDPRARQSALSPHMHLYTRLARSVRQTLALEEKLEHADRTRVDRSKADHARQAAIAVRKNRISRQDQVRQLVTDSIDADPHVEDKEMLLYDLYEHLEDTEIDFADLSRPLGTIAIDICKELGVEPDCKNWDDEILGFTYRPKPQLRSPEREAADDPDDPGPS